MDIKAQIVSSVTSRQNTVSLTGREARLDAGHLSRVALPVEPGDVVRYQREGHDLILVLANGETLILADYFLDGGDGQPVLQLWDSGADTYVDVGFDSSSAGLMQPAIEGDGWFARGTSWLGANTWLVAGGVAGAGAVTGGLALAGVFDGDDDQDESEKETPPIVVDNKTTGPVTGTEKNDRFKVAENTDFGKVTSIDGGKGIDTVEFEKGVDDAEALKVLRNIEKIDIKDGKNTLTIDKERVEEILGKGGILNIEADRHDTINISDFKEDSTTRFYTIYEYKDESNNKNITLKVSSAVTPPETIHEGAEDLSVGKGGKCDAGGGNDMITVTGSGFKSIDGGAGQDTLKLAKGVDLTADDLTKIENIESIDLTGGDLTHKTPPEEGSVHQLTLNPEQVERLVGKGGTLTIYANPGAEDERKAVTPGSGEYDKDHDTSLDQGDTITLPGFEKGNTEDGYTEYQGETKKGKSVTVRVTKDTEVKLHSQVDATGGSDVLEVGWYDEVDAKGGNDQITVKNADFYRDTVGETKKGIDGGGGEDTLKLARGVELDETALDSITNIETIELYDGAHALALTEDLVHSMTDDRNTLTIKGRNDDRVALAAEFTEDADSSDERYTVYHAGAVTVRILKTVTVGALQTGDDGENSFDAGAGDAVDGGGGNETITVTAENFGFIDGRGGKDTIVLNGGIDLDETALSSLKNIETINLETGAHALTLSAKQVKSITGEEANALTIDADSGDTVLLEGFAKAADQTNTPKGYTAYSRMVEDPRGDDEDPVTVYVKDGVTPKLAIEQSVGEDETGIGGDGDDIFTITGLDFEKIAGGEGNDTLKLSGGGHRIDLQTLRLDVVEDIETIDITGDDDNDDNTLTLSATDVHDMSSNDTFKIDGDDGDTVHAEGFEKKRNDDDTPQGYDRYTARDQTSGEMATLYIDHDIKPGDIVL
ncbi:MAG: BapA prefix-like domain-containing protein [Hyphomicrobiales bacterium]